MLSADYVDAELHPSPACCWLLLAIAVMSIAALWLSSMSTPLRIAVGLAVLLTLVDAARRNGLRSGEKAVRRFYGSPEGFTLELSGGKRFSAAVSEPLLVTSHLVVVTFVDGMGRRWSVPVFADAMSSNAFRRLKVFLKLANYAVYP